MRIAEKPLPQYPWYLRPFFWNQRHKYGQLLKPGLLWGRSPRLFLGVAAAGASVYATGVSDPGPYNTLAERWNGTSFQVISTPNVRGDRFDNWLGRAASDGTVVWAVGHRGGRIGLHTLVEYVC